MASATSVRLKVVERTEVALAPWCINLGLTRLDALTWLKFNNQRRQTIPRHRKKEIGGLDDLLLALMMRVEKVSIHHLYSTMGLSPGSTARSLERLKHVGCESGESCEDARETTYEITDEGREYLN